VYSAHATSSAQCKDATILAACTQRSATSAPRSSRTRPADGQIGRLNLSTGRGALHSLVQLFLFVFFGVCAVLYAIFGKRPWNDRMQNSRVQREATLRIQGGFDKLWDECISALNKIGAEIKAIDTNKGLIEGKTGWSWKSLVRGDYRAQSARTCLMSMSSGTAS